MDTLIDNPVLNISFAAVREVDGKDVFLSKDHIKEQIYRRLDLLKNLSAVTVCTYHTSLSDEVDELYINCNCHLIKSLGLFMSRRTVLLRVSLAE